MGQVFIRESNSCGELYAMFTSITFSPIMVKSIFYQWFLMRSFDCCLSFFPGSVERAGINYIDNGY